MSQIEIIGTKNLLEIQTSIEDNLNNITIEKIDNNIIEILTGTSITVMASDIIGLDSYIDNFLDSADIDCGSP